MADNSSNPPQSDRKTSSSGKILGMPRTTGIIVIGLGAVVVGYFVISKMGGSKTTGSGGGAPSGGSGGSAGSGGWWGSGGGHWVRVIKEHQGHKHKGSSGSGTGGTGSGSSG